MNITVYLGANLSNDDKLKEAAKDLGIYIAKRGDTLIYGGSKVGLMGILADSALNHGGKVIGVEPKMFMDKELQHDGLTRLIVTEDMPTRKTKMIELGDVFIAFPGGTGTLEEISEVMSVVSLRMKNTPCILYNLNGYYEGLKMLLNTMKEKGLSSEKRQKDIYFADTLSNIEMIIDKYYGI